MVNILSEPALEVANNYHISSVHLFCHAYLRRILRRALARRGYALRAWVFSNSSRSSTPILLVSEEVTTACPPLSFSNEPMKARQGVGAGIFGHIKTKHRCICAKKRPSASVFCRFRFLPTPVGPKKRNETDGFYLGLCTPRRGAAPWWFAIASIASFCPTMAPRWSVSSRWRSFFFFITRDFAFLWDARF